MLSFRYTSKHFLTPTFLVFALLSFIIAFFIFFYNLPQIYLGGDEISKWNLAKSLCLGEDIKFGYRNHHHLRWGVWLNAYFACKVFGASPAVYFIATIVPSFVAFILFSFLLWRYMGWIAWSLFVVLWAFSYELFYATNQLTPTGQSLVWLFFIIILSMKLLGAVQRPYLIVFALSIVCFLLYGAKLPYTFLIPGVAFICWLKGWRFFISLFLLLGFYYFLETLMLFWISQGDLWFGRLEALLVDSLHLKDMGRFWIVNELNLFFDRGVFTRWHHSHGSDFAIYLFACGTGLFILSDYLKGLKNSMQLTTFKFGEKSLLFVCAVLLLSFFIFTTFFVVSLDPITVGQPLRSRYLALVLPLAFILIIYALHYMYRRIAFAWVRAVLVVWVLVFFSPNINGMVQPWLEGENIPSLAKVNGYYFKIHTNGCFKSKYPRYLRYAKEVYRYWDDTTFRRLHRQFVEQMEPTGRRFYIPKVCNNPFYF